MRSELTSCPAETDKRYQYSVSNQPDLKTLTTTKVRLHYYNLPYPYHLPFHFELHRQISNKLYSHLTIVFDRLTRFNLVLCYNSRVVRNFLNPAQWRDPAVNRQTPHVTRREPQCRGAPKTQNGPKNTEKQNNTGKVSLIVCAKIGPKFL